MSGWEIFGAWVAAGLTICVYTFLYKDNPFYRFMEHLYVGISVGYGLVVIYYQYLIPKFIDPLFREGDIEVIIPAFFGICILTRIIPKFSWVSRWSFGFLMGFGAGVAIPTTIYSIIVKQSMATAVPLATIKDTETATLWKQFFFSINNSLFFLGVLSVLIYFFFSVEHKGLSKTATRIGIIFIMVYLGASYGATVMARLSLLYGRSYDMYTFGGENYLYATPCVIAVVILGIIIWELTRKKEKAKD